MIKFTKYSKWYYLFSGALIVAALVSLVTFGLKFGIEFTGGSNLEVQFNEQRPSSDQIVQKLSDLNLGEIMIQPMGEKGAVLRFKGVDEATHSQIVSKINELSKMEEKNFQYIGPSIGNELRNKTQISSVLVLLAITIYIAFAFRKVSRPVASWKYGITSLVALFHDIIIPLGVFSLLGKFHNVEVTIPIVAALLTVLGFSVHDTIVIFDRIRENILRGGANSFEGVVDLSLNQTIGRSISTVLTTLFVMISIFFFGGQTLKYFSLALIVGIVSGAYSSIFIAGPLLVTWFRWETRRGSSK